MAHSALFLKLLEKRGFTEEFLDPHYEDLKDPFLLPDMAAAVERIARAVKNKEKVLIYGDYDVDGVTATTIMYDMLVLMGLSSKQILTMLPDRFFDGYGMSKRVVKRAEAQGVSLVITVDCGSNNGEVIAELKKIGVDTVVTDHHEIMGDLPEAIVVNPKRGEDQDLRNLCGAGVAFFVTRAMVKQGLIAEGKEKWLLDLAMIGTICDSMELTGENRIICRFGMMVLAKTRRAGLRELMRVAGVKKIDTDAVGFQIGPRLNAAGRMETATFSLKLLLARTEAEAAELAKRVDNLNSERKRQQNTAVMEIERNGVPDEPVIVVTGKWHEGVVGIIAGKLTEKYQRPTFVLTETETGILKGSGRSFGEFSLAEAIKACAEQLLTGGGHAEACGVKLEKAKLPDFIQAVNTYYKSLGLKNQARFLEEKEDLKVGKLKSLSLEFMDELELLEPFGNGNPEPKVRISGMVEEVSRMGAEGQHLKLTVRDEADGQIRLLAFNAPEKWQEISPREKISALIRPTVNEWNGVSEVEGMVIDLK